MSIATPLLSARAALFVVLGLVALALVVVCTIHPYAAWPAQDPGYYAFADVRTVFQIHNCWNVLSNAPFLPMGLLGLLACGRRSDGWRAGERAAYGIVFVGVALTALGSSYFHYEPSASTLFWDRLPMTLVFTAMFSIVLAGAVDERALRLGLWPLVGVGVATVVYWRQTELGGHGELRPYLLVQFVPMVAIPLLLFFASAARDADLCRRHRVLHRRQDLRGVRWQALRAHRGCAERAQREARRRRRGDLPALPPDQARADPAPRLTSHGRHPTLRT